MRAQAGAHGEHETGTKPRLGDERDERVSFARGPRWGRPNTLRFNLTKGELGLMNAAQPGLMTDEAGIMIAHE